MHFGWFEKLTIMSFPSFLCCFLRPCVVEGENNAPKCEHFTPRGGPVSKGALLGVLEKWV
ncbi:hypothetical protein HanRHA438_Chr02g0055931 [Helianthus annuus]|nr:hypothetical protein HanRHA438_Chr02g0055931 [Helianthus annuus]